MPVTEFPSDVSDGAVVSIDIKLYEGFTVEQGVESLDKVSKGLTKLLSVAREAGVLTPANPIAQAIWTAASQLDNIVQQLELHKKQQQGNSGIVVPGVGPQRIV